MKNKIIKKEALEYFENNPDVTFAGYDDVRYFIGQLYNLGAKKVYVVNEYPNLNNENEFNYCVDTLYVVVCKNISTELAVFLIGKSRADECHYLKQHKAIRLWWD